MDILLALLLMLPFGLLGEGWFSADEVVAHQQVRQLSEGDSWALPIDSEALALDPGSEYPLLARSERFDESIVAYARHPLFPLLMQIPFGLLGVAGIQLASLLSILVGATAVSLACGRSRLVFWLAALASPTVFHVGVLWAHAPAFGLTAIAAASVAVVVKPGQVDRSVWPIGIAALALLVATLLRTEALLLAFAVTTALAGVAATERRWRLVALAPLPLMASALAYLLEPQLVEALIGERAGVGAGTADTVRDVSLAGRLGVLRVVSLETSVLGEARSVLRLIGLGFLVAGAFVSKLRLRRAAFGGAVVLYVLGFGSGAIPSFFVAAPLLVAATLLAGRPVDERSRSGLGQVVDAAMIDGAALLMAPLFGAAALDVWGARGTNLLDSGAPFYDCYETSDGEWMAVGAIEPAFWAALLDGLDLDPAELPDQHDQARWPELAAALAQRFRTRTRTEWRSVFDHTDACVAPVLDMSEAPTHEHHLERATFVDVGGVAQPAPAPRFGRTPSDVPTASPAPGADSLTVLAEAGLDAAEVERLAGDGVIGEPPVS